MIVEIGKYEYKNIDYLMTYSDKSYAFCATATRGAIQIYATTQQQCVEAFKAHIDKLLSTTPESWDDLVKHLETTAYADSCPTEDYIQINREVLKALVKNFLLSKGVDIDREQF